MAHAEGLSDNILDVIAEQVGELLPGVFDPELLSEAIIELRETFEVWVLEDEAITPPEHERKLSANPIGRWHHQVSINGEVEAFARSIPLGATPESWRVVEVSQSSLAGKIDKAIDLVDRKAADDPLVRLLIVPAYQVHAFWLLNGEGVEQVFVIDRPEQFTRLLTDRLLRYNEFLEALRREQHIIGRVRS